MRERLGQKNRLAKLKEWKGNPSAPTDRIGEVRLAVESSKENNHPNAAEDGGSSSIQSEFAVSFVKQVDGFYKFEHDYLGDPCKTVAAMVYKVVSEAVSKSAFTFEELARLSSNLEKVSTALKLK